MNDGIVWIPIEVVLRIHDEQLRRHGGDDGVLDRGRLEAALDRPRNLLSHVPDSNLEDVAALLAVAIAKGHPFVDGNKRTAAVVSLMFLRMNGCEINASEAEIGDVFIAVAEGTMSQGDLAEWFTENTIRSDDWPTE